jgi:hypothetical protein
VLFCCLSVSDSHVSRAAANAVRCCARCRGPRRRATIYCTHPRYERLSRPRSHHGHGQVRSNLCCSARPGGCGDLRRVVRLKLTATRRSLSIKKPKQNCSSQQPAPQQREKYLPDFPLGVTGPSTSAQMDREYSENQKQDRNGHVHDVVQPRRPVSHGAASSSLFTARHIVGIGRAQVWAAAGRAVQTFLWYCLGVGRVSSCFWRPT